MFQFPRHQFDHDGIVNQADNGHIVRDQVFRVMKVSQGTDHVGALLSIERPFRVFQHRDHRCQALEAVAH
ncbi:MAG: hypothetical protein ACK56I_10585, partial [bacterium]